jgi:hypothetical protein
VSTSISQIIAGALRYAGDLRGERVSLPDAFEFYNDSRGECDADLQFSESWRNVVGVPVVAAGRDFPVAVESDYDFEVGADFRLAGSQMWETLNVVAPERIADAEGQGLKRCSFYGEPRSMLLSFEPEGYEFQLRYVANGRQSEEDPEGETSFPKVFVNRLKLLTAHKILPHTGHDETTYKRLMDVIQTGLTMNEPRWRRFCQRPLKREGTRAVGFKAKHNRPGARSRVGRGGGWPE